MFKPGEIAGIKNTTRTVTIQKTLPCKKVLTNEGEFLESELFVAHPTVLENAQSTLTLVDKIRKHVSYTNQEEFEHRKYLSGDLKTKVVKKMRELPLDWNGHWQNGTGLYKTFKTGKDLLPEFPYIKMSEQDAKAFQKAKKGAPCDWIPLSLYEFSRFETCAYCGKKNELETNGLVFRVEGPRCEYAEGMPKTEFELNVPSGKLVVANDLRELFPLTGRESLEDVNLFYGTRLTTLAYAGVGMAHAFVGNSCPAVYKCADGTYKVANPPSDEYWDDEKEKWAPINPPPVFDGKKLAGICTDLWWYSLCDYEEFIKRCKHFKQKEDDFSFKIVKVPPGVYRFHHDETARCDQRSTERIYSTFQKVREADPVKDLLTSYQEVAVNAHAYIQSQVKRWATLFGKVQEIRGGREKNVPWVEMSEKDRVHSWQRVADHIFCVIGGGTNWHEKGFPVADVGPNVPDIDPPSFRAQCHWYPFSKPYGGMYMKGQLAPSFAKLLFRVLESIISFGMDVDDGQHSRDVIGTRERMQEAVKCYRKLAVAYPSFADPEYVAWLKEPKRAEEWVENFDLGPEVTERHLENIKKQRWVPEDAYAVEFDASKLSEGHFCSKMGWANKNNAEGYALVEWSDNGREGRNNCCWTSHAINTAVPLYTVARVVKVGEVSHIGETLVELAFDYGNAWMQDPSKRKALREREEKKGIRVLSKEEYEACLQKVRQEKLPLHGVS